MMIDVSLGTIIALSQLCHEYEMWDSDEYALASL